MRILVLDNDECTAYFSPLSLIHNMLWYLITPEYVQLVEGYTLEQLRLVALFTAAQFLGFTCIRGLYGRPRIVDFLQTVMQLKVQGYIDYVVMYTFASDTRGTYTHFVSKMLQAAIGSRVALFDLLISRNVAEDNGVRHETIQGRFVKKHIDLVRKLLRDKGLPVQDESFLMFDDIVGSIVDTVHPITKQITETNVVNVPPYTVRADPDFPLQLWTSLAYELGKKFNIHISRKLLTATLQDEELGVVDVFTYFNRKFLYPLNFNGTIFHESSQDVAARDSAVETIMIPNLISWINSTAATPIRQPIPVFPRVVQPLLSLEVAEEAIMNAKLPLPPPELGGGCILEDPHIECTRE